MGVPLNDLRLELLRRALAEAPTITAALGLAREAIAFVDGEEVDDVEQAKVPLYAYVAAPDVVRLVERGSTPADAPDAMDAPETEQADSLDNRATAAWTNEDLRLLAIGLLAGKSISEIAAALGRTISSINSRVHVMGGRAAVIDTMLPTPLAPAEPEAAPDTDPVTPVVPAAYQHVPDGRPRHGSANPNPNPKANKPSIDQRPPRYGKSKGGSHRVSETERELIDVAVEAGKVTKIAPGYHRGHDLQVLKDLE